MFRYKSSKQSFIIAALAILLCLSCLTGATVALFTSDPEDGTIGIVATTGSVKIDIIDQEEKSLQGQTLKFHTTAENPEILFEPGATFYTQSFQVKNEGSVPVIYKVSVNTDRGDDYTEDGYKPMTLEEFNQSFEAFIVTEEELKTPEKWTLTKDFTNKDTPLGAGLTSGKYYLVVRMRTDANDDFQRRSYSGVGITVTATQGNAVIEESTENE